MTKKPGANASTVSAAVTRRVDELRGTLIPADIEATVTRDYGATANEKAMSLIKKLVFATACVVLLVLAALGRREALIVGAAVVLDARRDALRIVGLGLHAEPRVALRADLLHRHPRGRCDRRRGEHPSPRGARSAGR